MEPVSAVFSPCLSCGCVTHEHCLSEYHATGNTNCPGGCDCDCGAKASAGVVESWEVMMGEIERMRLLDAKGGAKAGKEKQALEDWDGEEKADWDTRENINFQVQGRGLGRGYSTISKTIDQVRAGDWGMPGAKKRPSSLRKERIF
jgi:WD repeat-containing protein 59